MYKKKSRPSRDFFCIVRMEGLEPPRREAPDPKSGAATNYATCATINNELKDVDGGLSRHKGMQSGAFLPSQCQQLSF